MASPARRWAVVVVLASVSIAILVPPPMRSVAAEGVVTPRGTFMTLADALAGALPGETIEVQSGVHAGPLTLDRPVTLIGHDWPVIEGSGQGTVISVSAPGVTIRGFEVRGTGVQLVREDAAIEVNAPDGVIEGNRIRDSLFGVYLRESHRTVVRDNEIVGLDLEPARRGDGIRLWSSHDAVVEGNRVIGGRDVVLWYSEALTVRENEVTGGRYGLHFMYCDDALVENNRLVGNSVGAFLMYSRRLHLEGNVIAENRGPSGYGVGLKDIDDAVIQENLIADNRVGAYIDNSPREVDSTVIFTGNSFVVNDLGLRLMPSVRFNQYTANSFVSNLEQVEAAGGGDLGANEWAVDGKGNFWSDYNGFDADGDGYGDIPYKSDRLFERLIDRTPAMRILIYSPTVQAIDFGSRVAPFTKPEPKLTDPSPAMAVRNADGLKVHTDWPSWPLLASSAALLGMVAAIGGVALHTRPSVAGKNVDRAAQGEPLVGASSVSKSYGSNRVLENVTFEMKKGEGLALWGPNGAGKTTLIRCLLGVTECTGMIAVGGYEVAKYGKSARRLMGFVPQETGFAADTSVKDTLAFFARLRGASVSEVSLLLLQLGLEEHQAKRVRELSGGLRQRLAIAVAMLGDPPLLVMDEPTANLDAAGRRDVLAVLRQLRRAGKSLVLASHRAEEIAVLSDRVLVMERGRVAEDITTARFTTRSVQRVTLRLTVEGGAAERAAGLLEQRGFKAKPFGAEVVVKVGSMRKAAPLSELSRAGIEVIDFELSAPNEDDKDA